MEIAKAYGTVVVSALAHAFVVVLHPLVHAAATTIAVVEVFFAPDSTNATFIAVVYAFLIAKVIVEVANLTEVDGKILLTVRARPAFRLLKPATKTFDVSDGLAIELVVFLGVHLLLIADFIVAKPARPKHALTDWVRTLFLATSFVMFTT
jgi:hypothetical protein